MINQEFTDILYALEQNREAVLERRVEGNVYIRKFAQQERLILLGAGHVSQAVAELTAKLDFSIVVVDDRLEFVNAERFPWADEIVCAPFPDAIENLHLCARDYVCILTRGHRWDANCLRAILPGDMPFYLGMIGSKHRVSAQMEQFKAEGYDLARLERIHTPIGLPIHALTPAEIAVSIAAELILARRSCPEEKGVLDQSNADESLLRCAANWDEPRAMILVLEAKGSTPGKPGAIMLVDSTGHTFGTVGGGASEGEALKQAKELLNTGGSTVLSFDLSNEVAAKEGMACGGSMKMLVETL